jgi:hypothetical protein
MRLINLATSKIDEFQGDSIPGYVILSHTWGAREVTFQDMQSWSSSFRRWPPKLKGLCKQASDAGIRYVWVDSCCINKSDLVELSEAINSMFRWYQRARSCYVYLEDVRSNMSGVPMFEKIRSSRWFTRGWTLQELLAPEDVRFYDANWTFIGTNKSLSMELQTITAIPRNIILGAIPVKEASVAQRFSWVANRQTTRPEDLAYCLLGIFNVNMPMIYGEGGENAFVRLQQEIIKVRRDQSILAWGFSPTNSGYSDVDFFNQPEVLARHPRQFRHCGALVSRQLSASRSTFEFVSGTLKLPLSLVFINGELYGILNCGPEAAVNDAVGLPLVGLPAEGEGCFARKPGSRPKLLKLKLLSDRTNEMVYLVDAAPRSPINIRYWIYTEEPAISSPSHRLSLIDVAPKAAWKEHRDLIDTSMLSVSGAQEKMYLLRYRSTEDSLSDPSRDDLVVVVELDWTSTPPAATLHVMTISRQTALVDLVEFFGSNPVPGGVRAESGHVAVVGSVSLRLMANQPVFILALSVVQHSEARARHTSLIPAVVRRMTSKPQRSTAKDDEWTIIVASIMSVVVLLGTYYGLPRSIGFLWGLFKTAESFTSWHAENSGNYFLVLSWRLLWVVSLLVFSVACFVYGCFLYGVYAALYRGTTRAIRKPANWI